MKKMLKDYIEFYKDSLKKKHIVCTIISFLIFVIFLIIDMRNFSNISNIKYSSVTYFSALQENVLLSFIIIFAGITPYCFLSILGFSVMYNIASKVAIYYVSSHNIFLFIGLCIVVLFMCVAYSLCIATGIYYCTLTSKRFLYNQKKGFKFDDLKLSIYKLRKNEEKIKIYEEKKIKDMKKAEKLNIKIPYLNVTISFIISVIILILTSVFLR